MDIFIYALKHPITKEIRYIGKSINPKRRIYQHINNFKGNSYKNNWIKSLLKENLKPELEILEICSQLNWCERETFYISFYPNLTNSTSGGQDGRLNEEVRKKLSELNKGENNPNYGKKASLETWQKLSAIHKGKKQTKEHKEKRLKNIKKTPVLIDGVKYESTEQASRKLNIKGGTIWYRAKSPYFENYQFA